MLFWASVSSVQREERWWEELVLLSALIVQCYCSRPLGSQEVRGLDFKGLVNQMSMMGMVAVPSQSLVSY